MPRPAAALARLLPMAESVLPDASLLRAFVTAGPAAGEAAFEELVRRHGPMVLATCRRVLGNPDDAEDAFQATFLVLARKGATIRGNLAGWLYAVAVRTARGVRVMRDRRRKHELARGGLESAVELRGDDRDLAAVIDEELARLPVLYREALVLCELRGLSRKDASQELGIPEGTLSSRLASAKRRLAALLSARGLTAPAALAALGTPTAVSASLVRSAVAATKGVTTPLAGAAASVVMKGMLFEQLRAVVLASSVLLSMVCGGWAMTGDRGGPPGPVHAAAPSPRPTDDPATKLVEQLGSDEFTDREAAQQRLRELGTKAEPALRAAAKSENPEIRARAARALTAIRADARDALAKNFDSASTDDYDHPVWRRFKTVVGNDRPSRRLFAAIIARPDRLQVVDDAGEDPAAAVAPYREAILTHAKTRDEVLAVRWGRWALYPDESAYLLYLGTFPTTACVLTPREGEAGHETLPLWEALRWKDGWPLDHDEKGQLRLLPAMNLYPLQVNLPRVAPVSDPNPATRAAGWWPAVRRLAAAWWAERAHRDTLHSGLQFLIQHAETDAVPAARRLAADSDRPVTDRCFALIVLGRFGAAGDLPDLTRLLDDRTIVFEWKAGMRSDQVRPSAQARDIAAAVGLKLAGRSPADYGFPVRHDGPWFLTVGFDDEAARDAAHSKAKAFLDRQPRPGPKKTDPMVTKLIEDLGSAEFADREAAQRLLRKLGASAEAALTAALTSENPEVVKRCRELLDQIARDGFFARHWPKFAKVVGEDQASRELFDRIRSLRRNVELLDAVAADPGSAGKLYHDRWNELNKAARTPNGPGGFTLSAAPLSDVVGWMYLGTLPGAEGSHHQSMSLDFLPVSFHGTSRDPLPLALKDKKASAALRRLVGKWTEARIDYVGRDFVLQLALAYDIAEVLPAARKTLTAKVRDDPYPGNTARNVGFAMLAIGKLGTKDDLLLLERFANDETRCAAFLHDPPPKPDQPAFHLIRPPIEGQDTTTQLRDISAAMRLHMLGQKPEELGFHWSWPYGSAAGKQNQLGTFNLHAIGFLRAADRTAAHKKVREWFDNKNR